MGLQTGDLTSEYWGGGGGTGNLWCLGIIVGQIVGHVIQTQGTSACVS